jgi:ribosomal 50S subunit-recycling heat shock protein
MSNSNSRGANYTVREEPFREVRVTIPASFAGLRLDQALAKLLPEESRTRLARLIEEGRVRVDGSTATPRSKVKSGEAVAVALAPRQEESAFKAEEIALEVVHEDDHVLGDRQARGDSSCIRAAATGRDDAERAAAPCAAACAGSRARASCTASTRTRAGCSSSRRPSRRRHRSCASSRRAR